MYYSRIFFLLLSLAVFPSVAICQSESPVEYMTQFTSREEALSKNYLSYMSEIAHGSKARKMEKRRTELINTIKQALNESGRIRPYKGDVTLRDAYRAYWSVLLSVLTEDYAKIIDMEEIAERSYDAMEAYLLTQEKADEKIGDAFDKVVDVYNAFAANNNVTLKEGQSTKLTKRLSQLGRANSYVNQIFLIFFKSTVQENLAFEALNANNINGLEQTKNSMFKYASEGLAQLDTLKSFNNDGSLVAACRKVLEFQKNESQALTTFSDFLIKKEEFDKAKKSFDAKPTSKRTQADVDAFNKAVDEQNKAINAYNKLNNEMNVGREKVMSNWESTKKRFMDSHYPRKV
jgi:hypothetical protein